MGEILVYWIEKKLGLEFPFFEDPRKFRRALSNGYLIGEILRKFNVISDDQCITLKKSLSNRNCVKNMQYLHKWIRDSGMDVDFQDLLAIVEEEPGAAMRFIYRLYLWLECPKCFAASGFQALPNFKRHFPDLTTETAVRASMPNQEPEIIELKPWEGLVERNKKFPLDAENLKFVSDAKSNIYYEVPLQPPVLLNVRPYGGAGEDMPEDLYYDFKPVLSKRDEDGPGGGDWKREIPTMHLAYRISPDSLQERRQALAEYKKVKELQESYDEMEQFSEAMKSHLDRPQTEFKVYTSGNGNKADYRKTLERLKKQREEELELETMRNNYRKALTCQLQSEMACNLSRAFEDQVMSRVTSMLPSREKSLAEYVTSVHAGKQCFIDHAVYEQKQLAEARSQDLDKQLSVREQRSTLRALLAARNQELRDSVTFQTLIVQEEVMYEKNRKIIGEIINNLLDLVIKVATYREATGLCLEQSADILPPEPLMNEWMVAFHMADKAMEENPASEGQELTILDNYHVEEYLFHSGDWAVEIPEGGKSPFIENFILKKIVSYVLETVYPPPLPEALLPMPEITGAAIFNGVNFTWKPILVRDLLLDLAEPFRLQVLDTTHIVQEAIKSYGTAMAKLEESKLLALMQSSLYAYGEDEEEGEFQTLWTSEQQHRPAGVNFTDENNETFTVEESKKGRKQSDKEEQPHHHHNKKDKKRKISDQSSVDVARKRKSSANTPTKTRSRKLGKGKSRALKSSEPEEEDQEEPEQGAEQGGTKTSRNSDASSSDQVAYDPNDISGRAVEKALKRKDRLSKGSNKGIIKDGMYKDDEWTNENSATYEIVKDTLTEPLRVDVATEDDIQVLFGPDDVPETWPEFVRLGKMALDQLLSGKAMTDDIISRIVVERMRHYPKDSFVILLNYPHALCQAISLENSFKPNNLEKPPCYHHADMLIHQFKNLRGTEGDAVLKMALNSPLNPTKHRSALFRYGPDDSLAPIVPLDEPFRSFIDAMIVADVHASDKLKTQTIMNALEEAREKMMAVPDRTIQERINVLLHISFLQLKKFYMDMGLAQVFDLGVDNEVYYHAMKDHMELVFADKREKIKMEEMMMKTLMKRELRGEASEEEEEMEEARLSIPKAPVETPPQQQPAGAAEVPRPSEKGGSPQGDQSASFDEESNRPGRKGKKNKDNNKKEKEPKKSSKEKDKSPKGSDKGSDRSDKKGSVKKDRKSKASKDLGKPDDEEEDFLTMLMEAEEEETSATGIHRESIKPESFPSLTYNIEAENVAILANFWMTMEDRYLRGLRDALNQIRCHHDRLNKFMIEFRSQLSLFLNRPDKKQDLLTQFQEKFNQVNSYIRGDFEVKAELHNRVTELKERLSAICDERHDEAADEMYTVLSEGYLEGETEILTNLFITFIQLEADHYCDVLQFVNDFYAMTGLGKPETIPWCEILRIDLISRSRYSAASALFNSRGGKNYGEMDGEDLKPPYGLNEVTPGGVKSLDISSSLQVQSSQLSWNLSSGKSPAAAAAAAASKKAKAKPNKPQVKRRKSLAGEKKSTRRASRASRVGDLGFEFDASVENEPEEEEDVQEEEGRGGQEYEEEGEYSRDESAAEAKLRAYFADDEDPEIKIKKSYKQQIMYNYDQSVNFLESVMKRVMHNVDKIEGHTMNFLKTGNINKKDEGGVDKKPDESKPENPKKKEKKERKKKDVAAGKDGSESDSKAKKHHGKKKMSEHHKKESVQKVSDPNLSGEGLISALNNQKPQPEGAMKGPKAKGAKRTAEWQQAVEMEGIRVRQQLTLIHDKAKRELTHLKDMLLQVIMCAEKDAANTYKKEIDNVATVCDIFRFAIENGTPVGAKLTMEQDKFEIGSNFRPESSRAESEISRPVSSLRGYDADSNNYRSQSENEYNTTTADMLD